MRVHICNYVKSQYSEFSYYINESSINGCLSVDKIKEAFRESYELATSIDPVQRDEQGFSDERKNYREIRIGWSDDKAIAQCLDKYGKLKLEFEEVFDMIWDAGNGNKDKMMASLTLRAMPELEGFYGRDIVEQLKPEKVFGDTWSNVVEEYREQVDKSLESISDNGWDYEL